MSPFTTLGLVCFFGVVTPKAVSGAGVDDCRRASRGRSSCGVGSALDDRWRWSRQTAPRPQCAGQRPAIDLKADTPPPSTYDLQRASATLATLATLAPAAAAALSRMRAVP